MRIVTALVVVCRLVCCMCAAAPNPEKTTPVPDKRLDQKVTIKAIGIPLGDFLKDLSAKTGVKMTARRDVADDKLAVFVKKVPLGDVNEAVRTVLHLHCSVSGKPGALEYTYWMDLKDKNALNVQTQEDLKKLRKYMDQLVADSKLTPEQIKSKYKKDMWTQDALDTDMKRNVLGAYGALGRADMDTLWRDMRISLEGDALPLDIRDKLLSSLLEQDRLGQENFRRYLQESGKSEESSPTFTETWVGVDSVDFILKPNNSTDGAEIECQVHGRTRSTQASQEYDGGAASIAGPVSFQLDPMEDINNMMHEIIPRDIAEAANTAEAQARFLGHYGTDTLEFKPDRIRGVYGAFEQLCDRANVNSVIGYYTFIRACPFLGSGQRKAMLPVAFYVQFAGSRFGAYPTEVGDVHAYDNRQWFRHRQREIPERLVARWRDIKERNGQLGIREAIEMARLNEHQLADLSLYGVGDESVVRDNRKILAFLDSLNPAQFARMQSAGGLLIPELRQDQVHMLIDWVDSDECSIGMEVETDPSVDISNGPDPVVQILSLKPVSRSDAPDEVDGFPLHIRFSNGQEDDIVLLQGLNRTDPSGWSAETDPATCEITVEPVAAPEK